MGSRTIVDSVPKVSGPTEGLEELQRELETLRARFPGAIVARYLGAIPRAEEEVRIAPGAAIIGDVRLSVQVSIWYGCVLRADVNSIEIGARSNLQDGAIVHLGDRDPTIVEDDVVVGHRAILHGCHVESACLIGIQATILDGVRIGRGSIIGACALVTAGTEIPPHSLVLGVPGKVVKTLAPEDEQMHRKLAAKYTRLSHNYRVG
jgi:carbonic anhydrase/acetyltransferase-like protein (isoleucine patch superfamily)